MPALFGPEIEEAFKASHIGNQVGVLPRIYFTYNYLKKMCTKAMQQKALKDMTFCREIPLPGYYGNQQRKAKLGVRKATTYKGHYARTCPRKTGDISRANMLAALDLPPDWDVVSIDNDEPDSDSILSISEGETQDAKEMVEDMNPFHELIFMAWTSQKTLPNGIANCSHNWEQNTQLPYEYEQCSYCPLRSVMRARLHCPECKATMCNMCSPHQLSRTLTPAPAPFQPALNQTDILIGELTAYIQYL
ncbi:hypothetical protein VNO77_23321 [Canavalia gladiata]|uniref:Uncharacterized protein n=1 Tax=Canavalia gladiata TaxID=3824 RepID=A0AAN9L5M4_CANGL